MNDNESEDDAFHSCDDEKIPPLPDLSSIGSDAVLKWAREQALLNIEKQRQMERNARCWVYENQRYISDMIDTHLRLSEDHFELVMSYENEVPVPSAEELFQRSRAAVSHIRETLGFFSHALYDGQRPYVIVRTGYIPEDVDQPMGIWLKSL